MKRLLFTLVLLGSFILTGTANATIIKYEATGALYFWSLDDPYDLTFRISGHVYISDVGIWEDDGTYLNFDIVLYDLFIGEHHFINAGSDDSVLLYPVDTYVNIGGGEFSYYSGYIQSNYNLPINLYWQYSGTAPTDWIEWMGDDVIGFFPTEYTQSLHLWIHSFYR